ncbi:MAG: DUF1947 domain-containing protein [Candidatus Lokiarchaeota archaeon]|nr:DUF1947 domain-containing protein [Candidatus Lokiarchaeota archaeon]
MKIHQRHMLKSKDVKEMKEKIAEQFGDENINKIFGKKKSVEWVRLDDKEELIAVDGILCFWYSDSRYIPLLSMLIDPKLELEIKTITVDKGAIPYVTNGADVMRPGIIDIDSDILEGDIVKIQDPVHEQALAVGLALYNADRMKKMKTGKVITNIHTITDNIWAFSKEF